MGGIEFGGSTVVVTTVTGSVPTGGADTSAPVKIGGKALSAAPAAAAPSTIVDAYFDRYGRLVVYHDQALPVGTNEIGGVNLTKISGTAAAVGAGAANAGTQRVVIADDDANVSGILSRLDITLSALRDSLLGAGGKDLSTLETDVEAILSHLDDDAVLLDAVKTAVEGTLNTSLQTAIPAGTNEIGGVNISKVAGAAPSIAGKLDVVTADGDDVAVGATTDVAVAAGAEGSLSAKLRLITSQLDSAVTALQSAVGYTESSGSGTTTDDYVDAVTIDMRAHKQLKVLLQNTDAANGLTCKVTCYAKYGGAISTDVDGETALAAGAVGEVMISEKWAQVVVKVKSTVASTPATYAYEYIQSVT